MKKLEMKKLHRTGYCWRDESGTYFEWDDELEMFLKDSTLKWHKMIEQISDDEVIITASDIDVTTCPS